MTVTDAWLFVYSMCSVAILANTLQLYHTHVAKKYMYTVDIKLHTRIRIHDTRIHFTRIRIRIRVLVHVEVYTRTLHVRVYTYMHTAYTHGYPNPKR